MLSGYKTYITSAITILTAIGTFLIGEAELMEAIQLIVPAILAITVRLGITSETKKVTEGEAKK